MKAVFVGPTLADLPHGRGSDGVEIRGPAGQGDLTRAVLDGATVIGLIDGIFEHTAAVWHKEILYALSEGVQVFGGASMGALRAAECAPFGMIGIGEVFRRYADLDLVDDDAVGQVHGPAELDYMPLSEPLVNIEATTRALFENDAVTADERDALDVAARRLFFKERTYESVLAETILSASRRAEIALAIGRFRRDVKREDALLLVDRVRAAPDKRVTPPGHWQFAETQIFRRLLQGLRESRTEASNQFRAVTPL
jgi:hypothetical protein